MAGNPTRTWESYFPFLTKDDDATRELFAAARMVRLGRGEMVFSTGAPCSNYLLVTEGSVRVQVLGEGGREAVLYRVRPGQSCVLTTCCLLSGNEYPAEGFTETPVSALVFGKTAFDRGLDHVAGFRRFVFLNLGLRIGEVIARMEEVTFQSVERRLASYLLSRDAEDASVGGTHQAIAVEVGTVREVVSRHLKRLEGAGLVRLGRASVEICDRVGLEQYARGSR